MGKLAREMASRLRAGGYGDREKSKKKSGEKILRG